MWLSTSHFRVFKNIHGNKSLLLRVNWRYLREVVFTSVFFFYCSITRRVQPKHRVNPKFEGNYEKKLKKMDARIILENLWEDTQIALKRQRKMHK